MKKLFFSLLCATAAFVAGAQTQASLNTNTSLASKLPPLDKSPMDMAYYPTDYPLLKSQNKATQAPQVRIIYSRPQRDNRVIFGDLIEYNKVWRLGANESTEIEFFRDAVVGGKKISKGRYTLYAIPTPAKWTIIFNKDTDSWGAFVYDPKKDILRTDVPVQHLTDPIEALSMNFLKADKGITLVIAWENASISVPMEIK
ncbi:MAG: DUF2911 domain-containing protein [Flavisolibacter sp.]|jgi:hypothetical protein